VTSLWRGVPLRDLCDEVQYGYTASSSLEPVGPRLLRITDIVPDVVSWSDVPFCEIEPKKLAKYQLSNGDIVVARTGATVGYAKYIRNPPPSVFASYLVRFRVSEGNDSRYVGQVVESTSYKEYVKAHAGGAAQPNANAQVLGSFPVPVPPLEVQRNIAAVIAAYDELIENNLRRAEILEEMAQTVFREWFVDFHFPGHEDVPLVDSSLGPIPDGWALRKVVELAGGNEGVVGGPFGSKLGRKDYVETGVPVIRGTNLNGALGWNNDEFVFVSSDKFGELRGNAATRGDIIVTQRGTLGQVGLVPSVTPWPELVVSQSQMRIRVDPGSSTTLFVFHSLRWPSTNKRLVDHAMSAGVPHINLGILRDFKLLVPPLPLAKAYDQVVGPMRGLAENLSAQNVNLRSTRDLLLPKLVSGEIDVSDLDIERERLAS
jgi:type I restriction enzyme S subunit